jgi:4-diphosphocytidyl-2-C-methyl-D-erythritol kinase
VPAKAGLREFVGWLDRTINDLAAPARMIAPAIAQAEQALVATEGCLLARMSGSGATCFGIYADEALAKAAADAIDRARPGWWIKHGHLVGPDTSLQAS